MPLPTRHAVVSIAAAVALAGIAHAGPAEDAEQARALYETGKRHYDIAEYAPAIEAWKQAYLLSNAPRLLFNIGQAHRLAGDCTEALTSYRAFLREVPRPANRAEIDAAIDACERTLAERPQIVTPPVTDPQVTVPPGPEVADATGVDLAPVVGAGAGPPPEHHRDPPGGPSRARSLRIAGVAIGAAGVASIGAGVYFGLAARRREADVEALGGGQPWDASAQALDAAGRRAERRMIVSYVAGGIAAVGGGVLWWLGRSRAGDHAGDRIAVTVAGDGAELVWSCAF